MRLLKLDIFFFLIKHRMHGNVVPPCFTHNISLPSGVSQLQKTSVRRHFQCAPDKTTRSLQADVNVSGAKIFGIVLCSTNKFKLPASLWAPTRSSSQKKTTDEFGSSPTLRNSKASSWSEVLSIYETGKKPTRVRPWSIRYLQHCFVKYRNTTWTG